MLKKVFRLFSISLAVIILIIKPAYSKAIVLSDAQLDGIYVGGFEFDLGAAYAFRAAVIDQNNLAAISSENKGAILNATINAANRAVISNEGNFASANQNNISAIFSKVGDIINAKVSNLNFAQIKNIFTQGSAQKLPLSNQAVQFADISGPASVNSLGAAIYPNSSGLPEADAAGSLGPAAGQTGIKAASQETPSVNISAENQALSKVAQTNIAAVIASGGNVLNAKISNINVANLETQDCSGVAAQTNIALIIAKGVIENTAVINSNFATVSNSKTGENGIAQVIAPSLSAASEHFKNTFISYEINGSQKNITFITSLGENMKNSLKEVINSKFMDSLK